MAKWATPPELVERLSRVEAERDRLLAAIASAEGWLRVGQVGPALAALIADDRETEK